MKDEKNVKMVAEVLTPQVFAPVAVIPSLASESPVLNKGPTPAILCIVESPVLLLH